MIGLIKKDFYTAKNSILAMFLLGTLVSGFAVNIKMRSISYFFLVNMMTFIIMMMVEGRNSKNDGEMVSLSLPVSKREFIYSKYLGIILYFLVSSLCVFSGAAISMVVFYKEIFLIVGLKEMMITLASILIIFSFYFPILFRFGYEKIRMLTSVIYIMMIVMPSVAKTLLSYGENIIFNPRNSSLFISYVLFLSLTLMLYILSANISKNKFRDM